MEKSYNINIWNFISVITITIIVQVFMDWPNDLFKSTSGAYWIEITLSTIIVFFAYWFILYVRNKKQANNIDIFDMCENIRK